MGHGVFVNYLQSNITTARWRGAGAGEISPNVGVMIQIAKKSPAMANRHHYANINAKFTREKHVKIKHKTMENLAN